MNKLRECRDQSGLSQKQVAFEVGVKPPTVSQWESGIKSPSRENILKLAKLYQVSVEYLLDEKDDKKEPASDGSGLTPEGIRIAEKIDRLSADSRRELEKYVDFLVSQARRDT